MLRLDNIKVRVGDFHLSADFSLPEGGVTAIVGPSGSGKSTLLSVIAGFLEPLSGRVLWAGDDISELPPGDRPVTTVFQDNNLFPHLTVTQNVALGLKPSLRLSRDEAERVQAAIAAVGLDGLGARRPADLSGGQQSRAALARVLLRARPLILLDEPFGALGPALAREMLGLVRDVATRIDATVLLVTHDPEDALSAAEQTIYVDQGLVAAPKPTRALFDNPPEALAAYLGTR